MPSDGPLFPENYRDREVFLSRLAIIYLRGSGSGWGRKRLRSWIVSCEAEGIKANKRGSECLFESIELNVEYDL